MIPAGQLRHSITIQQKTTSVGGYGGQVESWSDFATLKVKKLPNIGKEFEKAGADMSEAIERYQMRFVTGLVPSMRILSGGTVWKIVSINDVRGMGRVHDVIVKSYTGA